MKRAPRAALAPGVTRSGEEADTSEEHVASKARRRLSPRSPAPAHSPLTTATHPSSDRVLSREPRKVLVRVGVVLSELLDNVLADVGVVLLDLLGDAELILGRDLGRFATVTQELLHERGNVAAGDGDVLDRRADDVALGDGDGVWCEPSRASRGP